MEPTWPLPCPSHSGLLKTLSNSLPSLPAVAPGLKHPVISYSPDSHPIRQTLVITPFCRGRTEAQTGKVTSQGSCSFSTYTTFEGMQTAGRIHTIQQKRNRSSACKGKEQPGTKTQEGLTASWGDSFDTWGLLTLPSRPAQQHKWNLKIGAQPFSARRTPLEGPCALKLGGPETEANSKRQKGASGIQGRYQGMVGPHPF